MNGMPNFHGSGLEKIFFSKMSSTMKDFLRQTPGIHPQQLLVSTLAFCRSAATMCGLSTAELVNLACETWNQHERAERSARASEKPRAV